MLNLDRYISIAKRGFQPVQIHCAQFLEYFFFNIMKRSSILSWYNALLILRTFIYIISYVGQKVLKYKLRREPCTGISLGLFTTSLGKSTENTHTHTHTQTHTHTHRCSKNHKHSLALQPQKSPTYFIIMF